MSEENKSLIVMPAVSPEEAKKAWELYLKLKETVKTPEDVQIIKTSQGDKEFLKKSYWRKISKFFNLSIETIKEWKETENEVTTFYVTVRVTAPNGAFQDGDGACSTDEKGLPKTPHNARATAITRAKNRAISDLVGGGEVSAEEILSEEGDKPKYPISEPQRKRLYAIWKKVGYKDEEVMSWLKENYGFETTKEITSDIYNEICTAIENKELSKMEMKDTSELIESPHQSKKELGERLMKIWGQDKQTAKDFVAEWFKKELKDLTREECIKLDKLIIAEEKKIQDEFDKR